MQVSLADEDTARGGSATTTVRLAGKTCTRAQLCERGCAALVALMCLVLAIFMLHKHSEAANAQRAAAEATAQGRTVPERLGTPVQWLTIGGGYTGAAPGDFSLMLLRQQWAPQWCCDDYSRHHRASAWCRALAKPEGAAHASALLLHGLWPQWTDAAGNRTQQSGGKLKQNLFWPQYCGSYANCSGHETRPSCALPSAARQPYKSLIARLAPDWALQQSLNSSVWNLGNHEWMKHGTCSNLSAADFVNRSLHLAASLPAPALMVSASAAGTVLTMDELRRTYNFEGSADPDTATAFACSEEGALVGVATCWSPAFARVPCPQNVLRGEYDNSCADFRTIKLAKAERGSCGAE